MQQFSGTQKTSLRRVERELARADALMAELEETCGFVCREFEYGPGLPVDYFAAPDPAAERAFLEQLGDKLDAMAFRARSHWKSAAVLPRAAARTSRRSSTRRRTRR